MQPIAFSALLKAVLISLLATLLYAGVVQPFRLFQIPQLKTQDFFFSVRHLLPYRHPALDRFFLITIDDESIDRVKERWPFPRRLHADLLKKLEAGKPRLVALDFIFKGKGEPLDDFLLAEAIKQSGNVVLAAFVDADGNYVLSLEELRRGALGSGVVNKLLDKDFYVRKARVFYRDEAGKVAAWPWEIEVLKELSGLDTDTYEATSRGVRFRSREIPEGGLFIPFHERQEAAINYRLELDDVEHLPLWQALEEKELADRVRGKIVVAGATSRVLHDYYQTPLGMMPGVMVNLNWLANLLADDFLRGLPAVVNAVFLFFFVLVASTLSLSYDILKGITLMSLATAACWGIFFILFCNNYLGDYFTPFLGGWLGFLGVTFYRYFHTWVENIRLRGEVVTDPLTGLYNRRFLESKIDTEFAKLAGEKRARKTDPFHDISVLMIDIDNFKKINDTYGHQVGDDVLKSVSFSIRESTRKDDIVARFGGEEFCVVLIHTAKEAASQIGEKIRRSVESKKFSYVNEMTRFTVSVGAASSREDGLLNSRAILKAADEALYAAKREGKNRVSLYSSKTKENDSVRPFSKKGYGL